MKCDLCGADDAVKNGLLCAACREAIVRLLVISEQERAGQKEAAEALTAAMEHPEMRQNTRKVGS